MTDAARLRKMRNRRMDFIRWLKSVPCMDCCRPWPVECMQFDHARGERVRTIAAMTHWSWNILVAELMKCDIVCANCHCLRTAARLRG